MGILFLYRGHFLQQITIDLETKRIKWKKCDGNAKRLGEQGRGKDRKVERGGIADIDGCSLSENDPK